MRGFWWAIACLFLGCSQTTLQQMETPLVEKQKEKIAFLQTEMVQLSDPIIVADSLLFRKSAQVHLEFDLPEAEIFYSLNDGEAQKYETDFVIKESTLLKVQARRKGMVDSDWIEQVLVKLNDKTQNVSIDLNPLPHENYPGSGTNTLIDAQKGSLDFRANNAWLGFMAPEVSIFLEFEEETSIDKIHLSLLADAPSWIFLPDSITVWQKEQLVGSIDIAPTKKSDKTTLKTIPINIVSDKYKYLKIIILNQKEIPDWHPGKGASPWLFIDEIFID